MSSSSSAKQTEYTALSAEEIAGVTRDYLRQVEYSHLQASHQLELEQVGVDKPDADRVALIEAQVGVYGEQIKHLRERLDKLAPSAG